MFSILLVICIYIFSNKYFFILSAKIKGKLLIKTKWLEKIRLDFHNPIFLVSLPTNDHKLYTSLPKDYRVSYDFEDFLFPKLAGIKVYYKNSSDNKLIFYSKISNIRLNTEILKGSKLESICINYLLFDKKTKTLIRQEVCRQLRERN